MSKKRQNKKESKINWGAIIISIISISVSIPISICSIKIAYRSLEVANKSYEQQVFESELLNRPYITVEIIPSNKRIRDLGILQVEIKNVGNTPAKEVKVFFEPIKDFLYEKPIIKIKEDYNTSSFIAQGDTVHTPCPYGFYYDREPEFKILVEYKDINEKNYFYEASFEFNKDTNDWLFIESDSN